jgi:chromate transporter
MMAAPALSKLSALYGRIGNLTFGGGDPAMAALGRELVEVRRWLTEEQFGLAYGLARVTPGTNVLAFCAATGYQLRGLWGAFASAVAASLPSAIVVVWITIAYQRSGNNVWVKGAAAAMSAAVVGMMLAGAVTIIRPQCRAGCLQRVLVIVPAAAAASLAGISPVPILAIAAAIGYFWKEPA